MKRILLSFIILLPQLVSGQDVFDLNSCLHFAIENNQTLQKDRLSLKSAMYSRKEVVGALLPQISASGNLTRNFDKTKVAMPNFINMMQPVPDPNAAEYMTIKMGLDMAPNYGASLTQQVMNFSLFNAVKIAKTAEEMASTGLTLSTVDVISQTAMLFYNIQVLEYGVDRFGEVIELMDRTLKIMNANCQEGLMRDVDVKRITVSRTNLETERRSLSSALEIQKRLLKLQMGFPMDDDIRISSLNEQEIVDMVYSDNHPQFDVNVLPAFKMLKSQQDMLNLQYKSAVNANLPVLVLVGTYSMNYMWDFGKPDSFNKFPMSMVSLNLKMPIFTGLSNRAKVQKAKIEMQKSLKDETQLTQALSMGYFNSRMQLDQQLRIVETQIDNKELAREVYTVTEANFTEGISGLTDLLNASTSLVQAEVNFATALNTCIEAYINLRKAEGTIEQLVK